MFSDSDNEWISFCNFFFFKFLLKSFSGKKGREENLDFDGNFFFKTVLKRIEISIKKRDALLCLSYLQFKIIEKKKKSKNIL